MIMDYEKEIPFGAFNSKLMHQEINIPEGFEANIEGDKIILKKIESDDERIRKYLIRYIDNTMRSSTLKSKLLAWLEKQDKSSDQIHYWTEEEIEPIISDYLRGAEHYGGMIGRLRCLNPKSLEKQRTSYTKSDVDDAYLKGIRDTKNELEKQGEQKPDWSIKEKLMLNDIIETTERSNIFKENYQRELIDWLKSLKDKYTWKPSIAQLNALSIVSKGNAPDDIEAIVSLYNDLKKLTE